jgi:hypothetical protein
LSTLVHPTAILSFGPLCQPVLDAVVGRPRLDLSGFDETFDRGVEVAPVA